MDPATFVSKRFGSIQRVRGRNGYAHFVPSPLPREIDLTRATTRSLSAADRALGRLVGSGRLLPDPHLLVRAYMTAEALSSSKIEGTQASLSEVFAATASGEVSADVDIREVQNHIAAIELGVQLLERLPLSLRLLRDVHARLLEDVRGSDRTPGRLRTSQNWIGPPGRALDDAVFVPPRPDPEMVTALTDWELFLNGRDGRMPPLIASALLHYQFETIHPFLDGNGRLGRLIVILHLMSIGELPQPLLYLSPWFERDRETYYARLQGVRERGEIQEWFQFFLDGITHQAQDAVVRAELLTDLQRRYHGELRGDRSLAARVVDLLFANPYVTTTRIARELTVTPTGARNLVQRLEDRGWLRRATTGGRGGRITWVAPEVMAALEGAVTPA